MYLQKPTNQYSLVTWLLITNRNKGVTMVDAIGVYFYKFQTRLLEVEKVHPKMKMMRLRLTKKNRFGHTMTFTNYKSMANIRYLYNLHALLCKEGLKLKSKNK